MVEKNANWATMDDNERVEWLSEYVGASNNGALDANFIRSCVMLLKGKIRQQFIKNMLSEVAATVYAGKTQEQIASTETRDQFYFACMSFDLEATGKCIYWAVRGEDV